MSPSSNAPAADAAAQADELELLGRLRRGDRAAFTTLVVLAVTRSTAPRWMTWLGYLSAALIATGVVVPLGLHAATLTNFAGYVGWCLWLIGMAVFLWRSRPEADDQDSPETVHSGISHRGAGPARS